MIVEICANSFESAKAAQEGGAGRIELCTDLSVGGLTPSSKLIEKVIDELNIPVHVLIRPRKGNFCYSEKELKVMLESIQFCKEAGCQGVVSGVLTPEGKLDFSTTERLVKAAEGIDFTFHRAFDVSRGYLLQEIIILKKLGITRLLSSGRQIGAFDGLECLKSLKEYSENKIQIMPGGGITVDNVLAFKNAGFKTIHLSAIKKDSNTTTSFFDTGVEGTSDEKTIREIINILS